VLAFVIALLAPALAGAKLAVFTDGRVLKVEDAFLDGDHIVLLLGDDARIVVPATRIDRVVADEVEDRRPIAAADTQRCDPRWTEDELPAGTPFRDAISRAAQGADLHPALLVALVRAESAFDPLAVSRAGACGLTQLMPAAAADHGVDDVWDPDENLRGGASHLRRYLDRFGALPLALAAYNAGAATVEREGGIPPYRETRDFVRRVLAYFCGPQPST